MCFEKIDAKDALLLDSLVDNRQSSVKASHGESTVVEDSTVTIYPVAVCKV